MKSYEKYSKIISPQNLKKEFDTLLEVIEIYTTQWLEFKNMERFQKKKQKKNDYIKSHY